MNITTIAAAAADGEGDLVAGLLIGLCIGFLIGPAVRSWLTVRERAEASRQARLADQILTRMRIDAEIDGDPGDADLDQHPADPLWRTLP